MKWHPCRECELSRIFVSVNTLSCAKRSQFYSQQNIKSTQLQCIILHWEFCRQIKQIKSVDSVDWLCTIGKFLSYLRRDFNYLCHINVELVSSCLTQGRISTTCITFMWRDDIKYKYMFFPWKFSTKRVNTTDSFTFVLNDCFICSRTMIGSVIKLSKGMGKSELPQKMQSNPRG